jgi:hypothetical protein
MMPAVHLHHFWYGLKQLSASVPWTVQCKRLYGTFYYRTYNFPIVKHIKEYTDIFQFAHHFLLADAISISKLIHYT